MHKTFRKIREIRERGGQGERCPQCQQFFSNHELLLAHFKEHTMFSTEELIGLMPVGSGEPKPTSSVGGSKPQLRRQESVERERLSIVEHLQSDLSKLTKGPPGTGLSPNAFFLGVVNTGLTPYILGAFPQYFWIWFTFKSLYLIGTVFILRIPKKQCYYFFDLCWVVCACASIFCVASYILAIPPSDQRLYFRYVFILCNGPLAWSVPALHCSLVFHNVFHTANLFIHLSPALLTLSMHWDSSRLDDSFPGMFSTAPDPTLSFGEMWMMGMSAYLCWWIPYTIWLLLHGLSLPAKGYDTIFAANVKAFKLDKVS
jgi:hypothetical protein